MEDISCVNILDVLRDNTEWLSLDNEKPYKIQFKDTVLEGYYCLTSANIEQLEYCVPVLTLEFRGV